jgi:large subunit ribosomal protein L20
MRTRKGAARTKAKRRLFKKTKGYVGGRGGLTRTAKETVVRAGVFAYRDRKVKKRSFRRLWITRINAACRMRGINYSQFMNGVTKAGIELDRKSLSEIAICDPNGFDTIVEAAKKAIAA